MGSSCWKMIASVREQFCTHWPEGIVRRKGRCDVALCQMPTAVCGRQQILFSFHCLFFFFACLFQGKFREVVQREVAVRVSQGHFLTVLSVYHTWQSQHGIVPVPDACLLFFLEQKLAEHNFHVKGQCFCGQFYGILTKLV